MNTRRILNVSWRNWLENHFKYILLSEFKNVLKTVNVFCTYTSNFSITIAVKTRNILFKCSEPINITN